MQMQPVQGYAMGGPPPPVQMQPAASTSGANFDPNTGQPIQQPAGGGAKFDPNTGQPIPKFDPETGKQNW